MNHASLFLDVVRLERQLAMDRWRLVRDATSTDQAEPAKGRLGRLRERLGRRRWGTRFVSSTGAPDHRATVSAACC